MPNDNDSTKNSTDHLMIEGMSTETIERELTKRKIIEAEMKGYTPAIESYIKGLTLKLNRMSQEKSDSKTLIDRLMIEGMSTETIERELTKRKAVEAETKEPTQAVKSYIIEEKKGIKGKAV